MTDKNEQIQALLNGQACEFACKKLVVKNMERANYADAFDVNRAEIDIWIERNGLPETMYNRAEFGLKEGLNLGKHNEKWYLFWMERGIESNEMVFDDKESAKKALVEWILALNGTGLEF